MTAFRRATTELRTVASALALAIAIAVSTAQAQTPAAAPSTPSVNVNASATAIISNDRLQASLRTEAENVSPAAAAAQVNATTAKALSDAKAYPGIKVATSGYSTQQIAEKGKPTRWRVAQSISIDATDFTAAATLLSKLQDENGLLLSGMSFSIAENTRRDAEDSVTLQAIKGWQARAQQAATGLGFKSWRVGHVSVQTAGGGPVMPMMRAQAMSVGSAPPVAMEGGTTEVTVNVSGDAVLMTSP
ncbi:MAG: SIMPL domain-containing protein [Casimicrobiaceae bacterium]